VTSHRPHSTAWGPDAGRVPPRILRFVACVIPELVPLSRTVGFSGISYFISQFWFGWFGFADFSGLVCYCVGLVGFNPPHLYQRCRRFSLFRFGGCFSLDGFGWQPEHRGSNFRLRTFLNGVEFAPGVYHLPPPIEDCRRAIRPPKSLTGGGLFIHQK